MDQLIRDRAQAEISQRVVEILNTLGIKDWQSEPHNHDQNFAELVWQQVKLMVERILNTSDAPDAPKNGVSFDLTIAPSHRRFPMRRSPVSLLLSTQRKC
jgi:hypothetical protein